MSASRSPLVIGVDPGPVPGIAVVRPNGTVESLQVTAGVLELVVRALVDSSAHWKNGVTGPGASYVTHALLAVERFVVGPRAARSKTPAAGETARRQVGALEALAAELGVPCRLRSAAEVKPWATDARLERAGLHVKGMTHARDAARHALYAAVHDTGVPDPLSRRSPPPAATPR